MAPTVDSLLTKNEENVRKWGTQLLYLMAPDAAVPALFFDATDHLPLLPAAAKQLGFITTDGISFSDSISVDKTAMLQSLSPVRSDITSREQTVKVAFGEDNAFVQALWHGTDFADFPATAEGAWIYDDGEVSDFPYYRLGIIMQDGVGTKARYRHEFGYRVKVESKDDRKTSRSDAETYGVTFGLYLDPAEGLTATRGQNGPTYHVTP